MAALSTEGKVACGRKRVWMDASPLSPIAKFGCRSPEYGGFQAADEWDLVAILDASRRTE